MQNKKHKAPRSGSPIFGCHIRLLFRIVSIRRTLKSIQNRKFKILKFWFKSSTSVHCSQIVFYEPYCIYICWHTVGLVTVESGERSPGMPTLDAGHCPCARCPRKMLIYSNTNKFICLSYDLSNLFNDEHFLWGIKSRDCATGASAAFRQGFIMNR